MSEKENNKKLNKEFERNYKLPNGTYFHVHENDEGYYYDIYTENGVPYDGGLLEYDCENGEVLTETEIMERLAEFTDIPELADISKLVEVPQSIIDEFEESEMDRFDEQWRAHHNKYYDETDDGYVHEKDDY